MSDSPRRLYDFGPFRLDEGEGRLLRGADEVPLTGKPLEVLIVLVGERGKLVGKDELMERVWPDTYVNENQLASNVSTVRKALGDDPQSPSYIKTVTGRGYRFVADVREVCVESVAIIERTRARVLFEEDSEAAPAAPPDAGNSPSNLMAGLARPALPAASTRRRLSTPAVALALALAPALVFAAWYAFRGKTEKAPAPLANSLAVLPFKSLTPAAGNPALELGMTDALITKLGNVRHVAVRPTSSVLRYAGKELDLRAVGAELGVEALVDGKVQREGDRIRLSVQLVRAGDGTTLWADKFDGKFTDIFDVQDEISGRVAAGLALRLSGEEREAVAKRYTQDAEAYQLYLQGRYFWNRRTKDDLLKAAGYFRQALDRDPSYALAHAGLADTYYILGWRKDMPEEEAYPLAKRAAESALKLDGRLAEAHTSLARLKSIYERDAAASEREFKIAIEINPNYATARQWYSRLLLQLGRVEEAVAQAQKAYELDPLSLIINNNLGEIFYYARRYDEALKHLRKARELDPEFNKSNIAVFHHFIYMRKGMYEEACREFASSLSLPRAREAHVAAALIDAYRAGGEPAVWRKHVELLPKEAAGNRDLAINMATAHARLGEADRAFEWLNRAADERHPGAAFVGLDPDFAPLRSDPRFADLVRRVSLP